MRSQNPQYHFVYPFLFSLILNVFSFVRAVLLLPFSPPNPQDIGKIWKDGKKIKYNDVELATSNSRAVTSRANRKRSSRHAEQSASGERHERTVLALRNAPFFLFSCS